MLTLLLSACGSNINDDKDKHSNISLDASSLQSNVESVVHGESSGNEGGIENDKNEKAYPTVITDMLGNHVEIEKKPEKVAVISEKLFELFHSVGGVSICGVVPENGKSVNDNMKNLPMVGKESNPDIIEILELEPDIVFVEAGLQDFIAFNLKKNDVVVISLEVGSEDKNKEAIRIMKEVAGIE